MKTPFRGFRAILYKEFLVVWRDPLTLFFMFFPPLIQLVAFGFALDTDVKHIATLVLDEDRTAETRALVDQFVTPRPSASWAKRTASASWLRPSAAARPTSAPHSTQLHPRPPGRPHRPPPGPD